MQILMKKKDVEDSGHGSATVLDDNDEDIMTMLTTMRLIVMLIMMTIMSASTDVEEGEDAVILWRHVAMSVACEQVEEGISKRRYLEEDFMDPNQLLCLGALFNIAATNVSMQCICGP